MKRPHGLLCLAMMLGACAEQADTLRSPDIVADASLPKPDSRVSTNADGPGVRDAAADAATSGPDLGSSDGPPADAPSPPDGPPSTPGRLASQVPSGGLPGPPNACSGLAGENKLTPGSMIRYCMGAHPDCKTPGAGCPLYVTVQGSGSFFGRLKDPAKYGKFITVEIRSTSDNDRGTLEAIAQVPRLVARDLPGLDENRIYLTGQSGGSYFIRRALCLGPEGDKAMAGAISDVYAGWASIIMCPQCDRPFVPKSGNFHIINIIGEADAVTRGQCQAELRAMATGLGCASTTGATCNVPAGDALLPRATGNNKARKTTFGDCGRGSVVGYSFPGEAHEATYAKGFNPPVKAFDIAWEFFQDKRKTGGGTSVGGSCVGN